MQQMPDRTEAADYFFKYIERVTVEPGRDICDVLESQLAETLTVFEGITEERSLHRYAPDKWSIRQVASHVNDTERVFAGRALWFARGLDGALPSFEQDTAIAAAGADDRSWRSHVDEFQAVRSSTIELFRHLPADAWLRRGVASGNPFSVRALAYITAGHVAHHLDIHRERYA
jgi:hypothetical protein